MTTAHDVKDLKLANEGREKPLEDVTLTACLHVTTETANLMRTLKAVGANVFQASCGEGI